MGMKGTHLLENVRVGILGFGLLNNLLLSRTASSGGGWLRKDADSQRQMPQGEPGVLM